MIIDLVHHPVKTLEDVNQTDSAVECNIQDAVLGVDAAWTVDNPSGLALIVKSNESYRIIKVGRSYSEFLDSVKNDARPRGIEPNFNELINHCYAQGYDVRAVALDLPLSSETIVGRRTCDNLISNHYGKKGAATHTPNSKSPGPISDHIFDQLSKLGYKLAIESGVNEKVFLEVYPHTSIIELLRLEYRLPYKVGKSKKYWPQLSIDDRKARSIEQLNKLKEYLNDWFENLDDFVPNLDMNLKYRSWELKGREDILDALIAALTGAFYLEGKIEGYGDDTGVIWVPKTLKNC